MDSTADDVDVTATIIDLAVRNHIQIEKVSEDVWRFRDRLSREPLTKPESRVMGTLFQKGPEVTTRDLAKQRYADLLPKTRSSLYERVTHELHWFAAPPASSRTLATAAGVGLILVGVLLGFALAYTLGLGLVGLPVIITGLLVIAFRNRFTRRTAEGSAVLAQAKGFELYLSTAEADQIRFEEGIDVFSRYLPYAIVFGVADRWEKIFADLAAQGRYQPTDWYIGPHGYFMASSLSHLGSSITDGLTSSMQQSMHESIAAQTQSSMGSGGSMGGSGFSGGGGFGGGGGGGW